MALNKLHSIENQYFRKLKIDYVLFNVIKEINIVLLKNNKNVKHKGLCIFISNAQNFSNLSNLCS